MPAWLAKSLPFLRWFPLTGDDLKADLVAGITVALVLIPQSMAYAQLAGLPAYYGLYASFLTVAVAAAWGSSNQLATGPVAVVSLLTASSLAVFAVPGSDQFVALAIMLALVVGVVQLLLGLFKLGLIVNFLSHPVILGFTNAAAMIIGLSQVSKMFGVPMGRSEHFVKDIVDVFRQIGDAHLPTLAAGLLAIAVMWAIRRHRPRWPGVLIAVMLTTVLSWATGFERNAAGSLEQVADPDLRVVVQRVMQASRRVDDTNARVADKVAAVKEAKKAGSAGEVNLIQTEAEARLARAQLHAAEQALVQERVALRHLRVVRTREAGGQPGRLYIRGRAPEDAVLDDRLYRIRKITASDFMLVGGGEVVGSIPEGLPGIKAPGLNLDLLGSLLSAALVISLVGFMEAISIAKAIAARTRQRLDPNQELIGQGLANIAGSLTQAFPVSGSFSRSAVNVDAGARTGMSSVFTALFVLLTLLFLTPLLYHLPQSVLAAIIIMAVVGLINFAGIRHAWQANRHDGIAALVTFVATLAFAPHLDNGILVGGGLALGLYLYRTMSPRVAILGRFDDGTLRDLRVHPQLPTSRHLVAMRFDGSLYFANVAYFEDAILEAVANHPEARFILVVGDGINQLDASGEEVMDHLVDRLSGAGVTLVFSGLKKQVLDVMRATGLFERISQANIFATEDKAITAIYERLGDEGMDDLFCVVKPARG